MSNFKSFIAASFCVAIAAVAAMLPGTARADLFSDPAFAQVGSQTSIPVGHSEFCKTHRDECGVNRDAVAAMPLTEARWNQLVDINNLVNAAVVPVTDEEYYRVTEYWTYPDGFGDCEDFVLAKRRALIEAGWNASTLLIAVVREANGAGHAVLMVRTDRGDLVLDNQDNRVRLWNETPYQFLKRQSQAHSGKWVDIVDHHMLVVAAAQ